MGRVKRLQAGFSVIETLLLVIVVGILGGVGWYVWHANGQANKNLNAAASTKIAAPTSKAIKTFEDCKKVAGSKIQETFPEVCVTKSGQKFTDRSVPADDQKYLAIKEWGVRVKLTPTIENAYYTPGNIDTPVFSQIALSLVSLKSTQCKAEGWPLAIYFRYTNKDKDPVSGKLLTNIYGTKYKFGTYYYHAAKSIGSEAAPYGGCQSTSDVQDVADSAAEDFVQTFNTIEPIPVQ